MNENELQALLPVLEHLHKRISVLEQYHHNSLSCCSLEDRIATLDANEGLLSLNNILSPLQTVLKVVDDVRNIESTIQGYNDKFNEIKGLCEVRNPNWLEVMKQIYDIITNENHEKEKRTLKFINITENDLQMALSLQQLENEDPGALQIVKKINDEYPKANVSMDEDPNAFLGVITQVRTVVAVVGEVHDIIESVKNFAKTITQIELKFTKIKLQIDNMTAWNVETVIGLMLDIIDIIKIEDETKRKRDAALLEATDKISKSFEDSFRFISKIIPDIESNKSLGGVFQTTVATIGNVIQLVESIRNYQQTMQDIGTKYAIIMKEISSNNDPLQKAITIINILKEEDVTKIGRDEILMKAMETQAAWVSWFIQVLNEHFKIQIL